MERARVIKGEYIDVAYRKAGPADEFSAFSAGQTVRDGRAPMGSAIRLGNKNNGQHVIHTGGRYDSHLLVPVIPIRPSAGKLGAASEFGVLFAQSSD